MHESEKDMMLPFICLTDCLLRFSVEEASWAIKSPTFYKVLSSSLNMVLSRFPGNDSSPILTALILRKRVLKQAVVELSPS